MKAIISQDFFSHGIRQGIPCVTVDFNDVETAKELEINDLVSEVMEFRGKIEYVQVKATLKSNSDAIAFIRVIVETNFRVVVDTDTTDDITFFVYNKRVNFSTKFLQPSTSDNNLNHASLNVLREGDEIVVESKDKTIIDFAVKALKDKCFTRPELIFKIPKANNPMVMAKKFTCTIRVIN